LKALIEYLDTSKPNTELAVDDYNINDPEVVSLGAKLLDSMIKGIWRKVSYSGSRPRPHKNC